MSSTHASDACDSTFRYESADVSRTLPEALASAPRTMRDAWFPSDGRPAVLLRWLFTEWCNYRCSYCPQTHDRHAPKGDGLTAHAFDNFPLADWIAAFDRHFADTRLSLVLTGGEPMLDRKTLTILLNHLSAKPNVESIRIDTNAWWRPDQFADLDHSKIILMCTFHPSQVKAERFVQRMADYQSSGYRIGMINYVMDNNNRDMFEEWRRRFDRMGLVLHPNPLWNSLGTYGEKDLAKMKSALPALDFQYRTGASVPRGLPCWFPALSYEMDLAGNVFVGCHGHVDAHRGNFFDQHLPDRPAAAVDCPHDGCVCLDKYSFLDTCERNVSTNPLAEYSKALRQRAAAFDESYEIAR